MGLVNRLSDYNWGYYSIPQNSCCLGMNHHICPFARGRGLGGTSLLNGLVYARGSPVDFDKWAQQGNPGWSYKDVFNYFKKSEDYHHNNPDAPVDLKYHGIGGYQYVEYHSPVSYQTEQFFKANQELGYKIVDPNSYRPEGASPPLLIVKHGRRWDTGNAFVIPVIKRHNLVVLTESLVTKVLINSRTNTAYGVQFAHNGVGYNAYASKEVILSGGVIGSAQILMLSGIGPRPHLNSLNISVVKNLEVGTTFRDHPMYFGLSFTGNYTEPVQSMRTNVKQFLNGTGPLTFNDDLGGVGFYQTSLEKEPNYVDLEIVFSPSNSSSEFVQKGYNWNNETYYAIWEHNDRQRTFNIYPIVLHQKSVGTLRLKSKNPYDYPLIDPNFLTDEEDNDINTLLEGIDLIFKMINTTAFRKINATYATLPFPACKEYEHLSKDYWICALRQATFHVYHPVGTCPMGPNPQKGSVVDHKLRVHGIKKLRVADASVFPFTLSGHPHAVCLMIGEKLSDMLKKRYLSTRKL